GVPHWGQPQAQNFSPFWLLIHLPLGTHHGHKVWLLFHHVVGFTGLYWLSRKIENLSRVGAFLAATIWTSCGFAAWHFAGGHATFLAFEWYPLLLLAWRKADHDIRWTVGVSLIETEMMLEGGHYPVPYSVVVLAFDSLARLLRFRKREALRIIRTSLLSALLTALTGAMRLAPLYLTMTRYPRPIDDTDRLTFAEIIEMWTAREHGWIWPPHPWVWAEYGTYVGWGTLGLVAVGIALSVWRRNWLIVGGFFLFLAFSMGHHGPLWPASLLRKLPAFSSLRLPSRWQVVCTLYMAILAGVAVSRLEHWLARKRWSVDADWLRPLLPWAIAMGIAVDIYSVALPIVNRWDGDWVGYMPPETPHLTDSKAYLEEYANYPARNISTVECYDPVPWKRSHALWTGPVPQVRFAEPDGVTMREGDVLHFYDRTNHTVTIDVEMRKPGVAIVNQNHEPQWHASKGEVVASEGRLAVRLPEGRHRVVFRFEPDDLPYSVYLSLVGLCIGGALLFLESRRRGLRVLLERSKSLTNSASQATST
ncbi:MAG: hypothetical protein NZM37_11995, partial [Sandaracinaceae bacterium]|nr:hypothetical protein [Sandaracinaceae bacterium]